MHILSPIRILVAEDHTIVREALSLLLSNEAPLQVVAQAKNGEEAIRQFRELEPDIVLMDLHMPDMGGIEATEALCREFPNAKVIILSFSDAEEDVYRAFCAGAKAYILKESETADFIATIQNVIAGRKYISAAVALRLAERTRRLELTGREMEVLQCLVRGMSNAEIGAQLFVSTGTIKGHTNHLLTKLQVTDRTGAVLVGLRRGLVSLE
ncbi:MAG: two component transcriptional regulator, LuxR family [Chthonomonadaceae bacterium]|nr:two component transcriptional regulator, LuxR family [Chthonomonadaceae bacterium]